MKESSILEKILQIGRKIIPRKLFKAAQPIYHYILAVIGAILYGFPGKKLIVFGVTGTKGKSTTVELVNTILEAKGFKTALASTIRYKIGDKAWPNLFKMTLRGRFFTQNFLKQAVKAGCTHTIIEISSEGVSQSRHKFLFLNALIFTNLAPEHIESHGSYENYIMAKLNIAKELESSEKETAIIANVDDKEAEKFLSLNIPNKIPYSLNDAIGIKSDETGSTFQIGKVVIHSKLPGIFNVSNMLGAIALAKFYSIPEEAIKKGLENIEFIRGRMEKVNLGQDFDVVVDYAHTPDSLKAAYETYVPRLSKRAFEAHAPEEEIKYFLIGILGNTGGGRDKWKREEMGKIADRYCDHIILANEDPYDENPMQILEEMKKGIRKKQVEIILDRREAIRTALKLAQSKTKEFSLKNNGEKTKEKAVVLITGKGTDPYIMGPNGTKEPWDDATVVREELQKILKK